MPLNYIMLIVFHF